MRREKKFPEFCQLNVEQIKNSFSQKKILGGEKAKKKKNIFHLHKVKDPLVSQIFFLN